jgi:hypothetical protein
MVRRLANVIYWACTGFAIIVLMLGMWLFSGFTYPWYVLPFALVYVVGAVLIYGAGLVARYLMLGGNVRLAPNFSQKIDGYGLAALARRYKPGLTAALFPIRYLIRNLR